MSEQVNTFIVDCPVCEEQVVAIEEGRAENEDEYGDYRRVDMVIVGKCSDCNNILVFRYYKVFWNNGCVDRSNIVRLFPKQQKTLSSIFVPAAAEFSFEEANRCFQIGAYSAACVMFGRALEAVCAHKLLTEEERSAGKKITLAPGIKELRNRKIIDSRLFDWSEHLRAFRNLAAHANEEKISREDTEDLQVFAYAIVEYIYDLTERYEEFISRMAKAKNDKLI